MIDWTESVLSNFVHSAFEKKIVHSFYSSKEGWKFFENTEEFHEFLRSRGIEPVKQAEKGASKQGEKQVEKQTERQAEKQTERQTEKQFEKQAEKQLEKITEHELAQGGEKVVAKFAGKRLGKFVPIIGSFAVEYFFREPDASASEIIARGTGGAIGYGGVDLTTVYDVTKYAVKKAVEIGEETQKFVETLKRMQYGPYGFMGGYSP